MTLRYNWTVRELTVVHNSPLLELVYRAAIIHRKYHKPDEVQISSLLSIKTGGCPEDCSYCSQSVHNGAEIKVQKLLPLQEVVDEATKAKKGGATRFCMGSAWREVRNNSDFEKVLEMARAVTSLGMEVCCTLGMVSEEQAKRLAEAGVHAYNHNLDTSEEYYEKIITTRQYSDRIRTLQNVRKAGMTVCSGGIIGLGEKISDRIKMLVTLASFRPHPESVPINALVPVKGTKLGNNLPVSSWDMVRMVATARIAMPKSMVRLSAGRQQMSVEAQALCFLAGANSIFAGDKLLTTPNPAFSEDMKMFKVLGLKPAKAK
ncbi:MAG: biotin synthase BioB [Bacteroidetes bacterium]|nr:biotin synthase BioB [Bacteroidota bacterium]